MSVPSNRIVPAAGLDEADLRGADLSRSEAREAIFGKQPLHEVDLRYAELSEATFVESDLQLGGTIAVEQP